MSSITVLMSVYKAEKGKYLDAALESVWDAQSVKPTKIVLVEDGPLTQELYDTIERWMQRLGDKLELVVNETNQGLAKALNNALPHISTDYIARMDTDDIALPERFALQQAFLDSHPDIAVVGASILEFNDNSPEEKLRSYPQTPEEVRRSIHKASPVAHPNAMLRREIFDRGIRYTSRYGSNEDIALWYSILSKGFEIANLPEPTLRFRRNDDVYKRRNKSKAFGEFKAYIDGIRNLDGHLSPKILWPCIRLVARLMPVKIIRFIYKSNLRKRVLETKSHS